MAIPLLIGHLSGATAEDRASAENLRVNQLQGLSLRQEGLCLREFGTLGVAIGGERL